MTHFHAAVWIDHREARIYDIGRDEVETFTVHAHAKHRQVHHKHGVLGSGHVEGDTNFFADIVGHLASAGRILITGPGSAKLEFMRFLHKHAPLVEARVVGLETVDHPTDGQLVAHARKYFEVADRMKAGA